MDQPGKGQLNRENEHPPVPVRFIFPRNLKFPRSHKNQNTNLSDSNKVKFSIFLDSTLVGDVENHTINKRGHYLILKENSTSHTHTTTAVLIFL